MTQNYIREIKGVLLFSLLIIVVPLAFFPRDFGLTVDMPAGLLYVLELGWYVIVFFVLFSRSPAAWVLLLAVLTLLYRLLVGIGFGFFLVAMFSLDLSFSLTSGIHSYLPAVLLQAIMLPFVLKSFLELLMKRTGRMIKGSKGLEEIKRKRPLTLSETERSNSEWEQTKALSSVEERKKAKNVDLEDALNYLGEYSGVKGAILVDNEGLVVACDRLSDLDPEVFGSLALSLKEANDLLLKKINEKGLKRIGIHTPNLWIILNEISNFTLVTVAEGHTDELLSVRISQATGMIKKHLAQRYNHKILKGAED